MRELVARMSLASRLRMGAVRRDRPKSGLENMQADEELLDQAKPDSPIVIRVYFWKQPTLSLGHFQTDDEIRKESSLSHLPMVRRKTGGGAILHDFEITYSVVVPNQPGQALKGHSETLYRGIHESLVRALQDQGWDARLAEQCTCSTQKSSTTQPFLCFSRRTPVDIVVGSNKVVGSAQRRTVNGLLQHGSLLLRRSASAPHLLGLFDLDRSTDTEINLLASAIHTKELVDSRWEDWLIDAIKMGIQETFPCEWDDDRK
jgi:lipoyl(octanoyl) transferase